MNDALTIAQTLDRHLTEPIELTVFGSAALLLDPFFSDRLSGRKTNDIDIIIPSQCEVEFDSTLTFWTALGKTNKELEPLGLYISHIFPDREVIVSENWNRYAVQLAVPGLQHLRFRRPRVLDLVLSKMGRGDKNDLSDVRAMLGLEYLVHGKKITAAEIDQAATNANVPSVYRDIFPKARQKVIELANELWSR